jgi:hypothetical protein
MKIVARGPAIPTKLVGGEDGLFLYKLQDLFGVPGRRAEGGAQDDS